MALTLKIKRTNKLKKYLVSFRDQQVTTLIIQLYSFDQRCYGPSVISVMVTKGGHLRGGRLYRTSKTMRRGVTELYKKFST